MTTRLKPWRLSHETESQRLTERPQQNRRRRVGYQEELLNQGGQVSRPAEGPQRGAPSQCCGTSRSLTIDRVVNALSIANCDRGLHDLVAPD